MMAKYDALNPAALKKLAASGAKLRPYPQDVMEAAFKAANETYAEVMATNAPFKKIYELMTAFRADQYLWFQVSEHTYDTLHDGPAAQEDAVTLGHANCKGAVMAPFIFALSVERRQ